MEGQRVPEEDVGQKDGERVAEGGGDEQDRMRRGDAHARSRDGRSARHKNAPRRYVGAYPFEFRLRVAKLRTEEGLPLEDIAREAHLSPDTIIRWARLDRDGGEEEVSRGRAYLFEHVCSVRKPDTVSREPAESPIAFLL